ncbi:hypothetical protein [Lentibacter sp. XHP0401]|uniref:hypothetical protein n=1 Tax=Lentibacter sp. XHP0401 TaxID=2984334 RepID=UPI0021E8F9CB|nr:hypothetical protein [Lentibacter sp. XHP0401]MCV2893227.1 hypothetical protein [Lentibacter sp. XHP0401]
MNIIHVTVLSLSMATATTAQQVSENALLAADELAPFHDIGFQAEDNGLISWQKMKGGTVYTIPDLDESYWDSTRVYNFVGASWNGVAKIEDVLLNEHGVMSGVVVDIGGLTGKDVVIPAEYVSLIQVEDGELSIVTLLERAELKRLGPVGAGA